MNNLIYLQITVQPWERNYGTYKTKELIVKVIRNGDEAITSRQVIDGGDDFRSIFDYAIERAIHDLRHELGLLPRQFSHR